MGRFYTCIFNIWESQDISQALGSWHLHSSLKLENNQNYLWFSCKENSSWFEVCPPLKICFFMVRLHLWRVKWSNQCQWRPKHPIKPFKWSVSSSLASTSSTESLRCSSPSLVDNSSNLVFNIWILFPVKLRVQKKQKKHVQSQPAAAETRWSL